MCDSMMTVTLHQLVTVSHLIVAPALAFHKPRFYDFHLLAGSYTCCFILYRPISGYNKILVCAKLVLVQR